MLPEQPPEFFSETESETESEPDSDHEIQEQFLLDAIVCAVFYFFPRVLFSLSLCCNLMPFCYFSLLAES
jgi:hypothetical protein